MVTILLLALIGLVVVAMRCQSVQNCKCDACRMIRQHIKSEVVLKKHVGDYDASPARAKLADMIIDDLFANNRRANDWPPRE